MCSILVWFPLCLMTVTMYTSAKVGDKLGNKCESGQYKSDFLSGGCAKCPKILKDCEDQEIDDAVRCFNACTRIYSTSQPKGPTTATLTTIAPKIKFVINVHENFTERHYYDRFKYTLIQPTSNNLPEDKSNMADIIIGMIFSVVALVLVCLAFIYWKRRRITTNDQLPRSNPSDYSAVAVESRSNSNEDLETSGQTHEQDEVAEAENTIISIPSVSLEGLNGMAETYL